MNEPMQLADVLEQHVKRTSYTPGQLARLSGLPKATIVNWLEGRVRRPRERSDLIKLAAALHLDATAASELLRAAGYPPIAELLALARTEQERKLLAPWAETVVQWQKQAPFQAIADMPYFVGREHELRTIKTMLLTDRQVLVHSIQGMGGVGKTALAAHIAYELRPYFPDGVLWARLDASDPLAILSTFALAYGRDVRQYPDLHSRSQVVREVLAHKRVLIVLDNARTSEEIEPLLPPSGSCAVIITTRRHDLQVTAGVHRHTLSPFDRQRAEALALFNQLLGVERTRQERAPLLEIADVLGHLPLAIVIVASRLAYEPGWSAEDFLARLSQQRRRLSELVYDNWSVQLSFQLSYEALPAEHQALFSTFGAFSREDIGIDALAAVAGRPLEETQDGLRRLYSLSLVQQSRPGRYRLHPLLYDYAREHLRDPDSAARMVAYYVQLVETHQRDYAVLDVEISNIIAALQVASERGPHQLLRGVAAFYHFLEVRGLYTLALGFLEQALRVARESEAPRELAVTLHLLGRLMERQGRYAEAEAQLQEGLALARSLGAHAEICALLTDLSVVVSQRGDYAQGEAYLQEGLVLARSLGDLERISQLLTTLGVTARRQGDVARAEAYYLEALELARTVGDRESLSLLLANLSGIAGQRGDYAEAEAYLQEGLTLARQIDHRERLILLLTNLGLVTSKRGDYRAAQAQLQEGLALARQIGHRERMCILLFNLGAVAEDHGDSAQAETYLREALGLARQMQHHWLISAILLEWGELYLARGRHEDAAAAFAEAQTVAQQHGVQEYSAAALYGLAQLAALAGDYVAAQQQGRQSLEQFQALRHPRAEEVTAWLATLGE